MFFFLFFLFCNVNPYPRFKEQIKKKKRNAKKKKNVKRKRVVNVPLQRPLCSPTDPQRLPVAGNRCHRCGMRVSKWRQDNDRLTLSYHLMNYSTYIYIILNSMKRINQCSIILDILLHKRQKGSRQIERINGKMLWREEETNIFFLLFFFPFPFSFFFLMFEA